MKHIWKAAAMFTAAMMIASCDNNKFTVEGQINNAKDSVLYFENVGLEGIQVLDSVKLNDNGDFSFSEAANLAPEFYRLRISNQIINVSIDSTETVQIKAEYPDIETDDAAESGYLSATEYHTRRQYCQRQHSESYQCL